MIFLYAVLSTFLLTCMECGTYQHVRFYNNANRKAPRHIDYSQTALFTTFPDVWETEPILQLEQPILKGFSSFNFHPPPPVVYDPDLLTGSAARRAVRILYSKELFFGDIPHFRMMVVNQNMRRKNGLSIHRLGSIRWGSPWFRRNNF